MKYLFLFYLCAFLSCTFKAQDREPIHSEAVPMLKSPYHNTIQLALLLDVSSSMDGLIDQAKSELWTIVNEVAKAKKNNVNAKLEIALYEYGRGTSDARTGYITKLLNYTSNLDSISMVLFSLRTNGGDEYCGQVIQNAVNELSWRDNDSIYKVIFIAGNEPFNQGPVDYKNAAEQAKSRGIFINTIYCGEASAGSYTFWLDGAKAGNGEYFSIDQNAVVQDIPTPYDAQISRYNDSLNATYWSYGADGSRAKEMQVLQDKNAESMSASVKAKRAVSKASALYDNSRWDVLDAVNSDSTWIEKTKDDALPQQLKNKSLAEKKSILSSNAHLRTTYSARINQLNIEREIYIRSNSKDPQVNTLSNALILAIHKQAASKGFVF